MINDPMESARAQEREQARQTQQAQERQLDQRQHSAVEMQQERQRQQQAFAQQQQQTQDRKDSYNQVAQENEHYKKKEAERQRNRNELKRQPRDTASQPQPVAQRGAAAPPEPMVMSMLPGHDIRMAGAMAQAREAHAEGVRQVLSTQENPGGEVREKLTGAELGKKIFAQERQALREHGPHLKVSAADLKHYVDTAKALGVSTDKFKGAPSPDAASVSAADVTKARATAEKLGANPAIIDQLKAHERDKAKSNDAPRRELSSETAERSAINLVTQIFDADRPRSERMEYIAKGEIDPAVKAVPIADVLHLADVAVRLENNSEDPIFHGLNEEPKELEPAGKRPQHPTADEIKRATEIAKTIDPGSRVAGALEDHGREAALRENSRAPDKPVTTKEAAQLMDVASRLGISSKDLLQKSGEIQTPPSRQEVSAAIRTAEKLGTVRPEVMDKLKLAEREAKPEPERVKHQEQERDMGR